ENTNGRAVKGVSETSQKLNSPESPHPEGWVELDETPLTELAPTIESFLESDALKHGYGILVPLEIIENGQLRETLKEFSHFEKKFLRNPEFGSVLGHLRERLQLSARDFDKSIVKYKSILNNNINLYEFLHLPENPIIQQKLTQGEIETLEKKLNNILVSENTSIYAQGKKSYEVNFHPENLEKIKIGNKNYMRLPISKWELAGKREEIKQWVLNYYKDFKKAPTSKQFSAQFVGFINHEAKAYNRTYNQFLKECKIPPNKEREHNWTDPATIKLVKDWIIDFVTAHGRSPYYREVMGKFGGFYHYLKQKKFTYNEFLKVQGHVPNLEYKHDWADPATIKSVEKWVVDFVKAYGRSPYLAELIKEFGGFQRYLKHEKLVYNEFLKARGHVPNLEYEHNWSDPSTIKSVENWITDFAEAHGRSPFLRELQEKFGGFTHYLKYKKLTYNKFLKERGHVPNLEYEHDWAEPATIKSVENWVADFVKVYGRSPFFRELQEKFGGFQYYLTGKKLTYNEFLKARGYIPNVEYEHDWADPSIIKSVENWIADFAEAHGRSPYYREVLGKFGGLQHYLTGKKLTYNEFLKARGHTANFGGEYNWSEPTTIRTVEDWVADFVKIYGRSPLLVEVGKKFGGFSTYLIREGLTWNGFLEARGYQTHELEEAIKEGVIFDKVGKDCMEVLYDFHQFRVFHPLLKNHKQKYVIPDCIVHDFSKIPLKTIGKSIYLEVGQRFDTIIEIKRSFASISAKEWEIYALMAKKMKVYFLKGNINLIQDKNGCQIMFYSKNELIQQLRSEITPDNKKKIESLIEKIYALDKRLDLQGNKKLDDF
ncbi:MAG: hypothetical protein HWN66_18385, partial [Candidatus Helarchaeota archaeon]|nr:hypothetical protein [Candidatus Helarchaeota archaeon]